MRKLKKLVQFLEITINERHINFSYGYRCITYIVKLVVQVWRQKFSIPGSN